MSMVNRSQSSRFSLQSLWQEAAGQKVKKKCLELNMQGKAVREEIDSLESS